MDKRNEKGWSAHTLREIRAGAVLEHFAKFLRLSVIAGLCILAPMAPAGSQSVNQPMHSASGPAPDSAGIDRLAHLTVILNKSRDMKIAVPFAVATVGAPEIADILPMGDRRLYVLGKRVGATNVLLYDQANHLVGVVDVEVKLDTAAIGAKIRAGSGGRNIQVSDVNGAIVLSGDAADAQTVDRAMRVASGIARDNGVVNGLKVSSPQQVMLQVRFVEADRSAVRNLGVRWDALWRGGKSGANVGQLQSSSSLAVPNNGGVVADAVAGVSGASPFATILASIVNSSGGKLDMVLSALEEQQVVRRLAEPNLVASSGETADFLAGGEFPVPISSTTGVGGAPTVTISYKEFGVKLKFTPTVLADGVISLKLEPEVSDLDTTISVSTGGVTVPGIIKSRASTTVELRDGQSFAIAGMLQAKSQRQIDGIPWLGTMPVLGSLFSSKQFQQNETELVVIVCPRLIRPNPRGKVLKTPLDTSLAANDVDFFLNNKPEIPKSPPTYVNRNGYEQTLDGGLAPGAPGLPLADTWHWPWESK